MIPLLLFLASSFGGDRRELPADAPQLRREVASRSVRSTAADPLAWLAPSATHDATIAAFRPFGLDTIEPGLRTFLEPNAPNPFSTYTRIGFTIPRDGQVSLRIYDFWYRLVVTLVDGERSAGRHVVDFLPFRTDPVPDSGMYFYELRYENERLLRRMLLIK